MEKAFKITHNKIQEELNGKHEEILKYKKIF